MRNICKNTLMLIILALIFTSCASTREPAQNDGYGSITGISENESLEASEKATASKRLNGTGADTQNGHETFKVSIQLYDIDKGKAVPYSPYLTMQEQSFVLDFSMPADKSSVEKSVDDNILSMWRGEYIKPVKPTISFNWNRKRLSLMKSLLRTCACSGRMIAFMYVTAAIRTIFIYTSLM